ncbi:MAG: hypothetical protein ACRDRL_31290, partial [Sciscionella sp.]
MSRTQDRRSGHNRCSYEGLASAAALHALEPGEEEVLNAHLPGCARCRHTVQYGEDVASQLGAAIPQVDPPAELRDRIMDMAAHTPQVSPRHSADARESAHREADSPAEPASRVVDHRAHR